MCERVAPRLVQRVTWLETELVHVKVLGFQAQVYTIYASVYHNLAICHLRIMQSTRRKEWDSETRSMKFSPNLFVLCSWYHQTSDTQTVLWVAQHAGFIVHVCISIECRQLSSYFCIVSALTESWRSEYWYMIVKGCSSILVQYF